MIMNPIKGDTLLDNRTSNPIAVLSAMIVLFIVKDHNGVYARMTFPTSGLVPSSTSDGLRRRGKKSRKFLGRNMLSISITS